MIWGSVTFKYMPANKEKQEICKITEKKLKQDDDLK